MTCIPLATAKPMVVTAFVLTAYDCTRHLYEQHSRHKGQAALWVTNGCTSMSKPITIWAWTKNSIVNSKSKNAYQHYAKYQYYESMIKVGVASLYFS